MTENKEIKPVVLQILPELDQGGVERGTVEIATFLKEKGIKNFVASQGGRMAYGLEKAKVKHFVLPLKTKNPVKLYLNSKKIEQVIKENNINIVHARSRAPAWSAYWAAKRCGVKFVTTFHGTYGLGPWGLKKLYNRVMVYGDLVIAISNHIKAHIIENYKTNIDKIRMIHRCVDLDKFDPRKITQERMINIIKEHHIPEDKPIILLWGRLTRWKGQHLLIDALSQMKDKEWHCILGGDDQGRTYYTEELKESIKNKGLEGKFTFIQHTSDMPALMLLSSIVVSASTEPEAFGRIAIEGQAMGRVVVASNIGGSLESIVNGKTGRLFESENSSSLADALNWALALDDNKKNEISVAAIENVVGNFSKDLMCEKTLSVYNEVLKS